MTIRYKLTLEYDGLGFVGWQRQAEGVSVQGVLEEAARRFTGFETTAVAAGRTDSGVHALAMVAHVDLARSYDPDTVLRAINFHMKPHPVCVLAAELAPDGFHARFSAIERSYLYRILCRKSPPVIDRERVWWVPHDMDAKAMDEAAKHLIGQHDFTSFRATSCQAASPVKTLDQLDVTRDGAEIHIRARARSFLHHQVRNMAGSLKLVGEGKWTQEDLRQALIAKDREAGGPTAPSRGLYFVAARYPED